MSIVLLILLQFWTFVASMFLIIGGLTRNGRYDIEEPLRKRMIFVGGLLLFFLLMVHVPELYSGFVKVYSR